MEQTIILMMSQLSAWMIFASITLSCVGLLIAILFIVSLYSAMKKVPEQDRVFPAWFCWMFLIPVAGFVFKWIMVPFGIPKTFKKHLPNNPEAQRKAGTLFGIGLSYMIMFFLLIIPIINFFAVFAIIVLFIIYWVKVVAFKNEFLIKKDN